MSVEVTEEDVPENNPEGIFPAGNGILQDEGREPLIEDENGNVVRNPNEFTKEELAKMMKEYRIYNNKIAQTPNPYAPSVDDVRVDTRQTPVDRNQTSAQLLGPNPFFSAEELQLLNEGKEFYEFASYLYNVPNILDGKEKSITDFVNEPVSQALKMLYNLENLWRLQ